MYNTMRWIIITLIGTGIIMICLELMYFYRLKYKYGKKNAKKKYFERGRPFVSKKRPEVKRLLVNIGWNVSTEQFYIIKLVVAFLGLVISFAVIETNREITIESIKRDINYQRTVAEDGLQESEELIQYEILLLEKSKRALEINKIQISDLNSLEIIESTIKDQANYENYQVIAKRLKLKIEAIEETKNNVKPLLMCLLITYLMYIGPEKLGKIKLKLINNKKDWETLNCMATYSIVSKFPNCKIETIINGMADVTTIYKGVIGEYGEALKKRNTKECTEILESIDEEGMEELLEQLEIANVQGISVTNNIIEDLIQTKMEWLQITATKRRKVKLSVTFIPICIILFLLFTYMMYGMTVISTNNFIEL